MNQFRQSYDKLKEADKDQVMDLLFKALKWRGNEEFRRICLCGWIEEAGEVFERNGTLLETYT